MIRIAAAAGLGATALAFAAAGNVPACGIPGAIPAEVIHLAQAAPSTGTTRTSAIELAAERLRDGKVAEARALLTPIAEGSAEGADRRALAASLLAIAFAAEGDPKPATEWARRALALLGPGMPAALAAPVALNAAFALAETGDAKSTRAALEQAERHAAQSGDALVAASALVNLAVLEARVGGDAQGVARRAFAAARKVGNDTQRASLLVAIGLALVPAERTPAGSAESLAAEVLAEAYRAASAARNPRHMAHALGLIGELQLRSGAAKAAREALERAAVLSRAAADDPWRFRWTWLLGVVQRELGDDKALATLDEAVAQLEAEKARRSFAAYSSVTLARDYGRVYRDLADLLLVRAARAQGEAAQGLLERTRDVLELSRTAEIEDFFRDPCIARRGNGRPGAPAATVAVIYPIPFADRTEILVAHASGFARFSSSRGVTEVAREVRRLRSALEPPGLSTYLVSARRLHQWLVAPMSGFLASKGVKTIVWVPDGALRGLPPAVLNDGEAHLIEKYAIAVTPLASLADGVAASARPRAALTGLSLSRQGFPALPAVSRELDNLSAILSAPVLRDESFTVEALRATMEKTPVNVIHVASHGQFAPEPGETFLLTYDGRLTLAQLRGALAAGKLREEPIELLTLSACQTAAGDERSALGLAGVAIGAGARSALATLWSVGDESTAQLVGDFYQRLLVPGTAKAAALREAQLRLAKDERYSHPAFWAPYLLIGNWN